LRSYTANEASVQATGGCVDDVLADLNATYPGLRFRIIDEHNRIRRHIKLFLNKAPLMDLSPSVKDGDVIHIIAALSGG